MFYTQYDSTIFYNNFYVYVYLDPLTSGQYKYGNYTFDHEPFYVGKGSGNRIIYHIKSAKNNYKYDTQIKKCERIKQILYVGVIPIILLLYENIVDENQAYKLETEIIAIIGLESKLSGPLLNCGTTKGGKKGIKHNRSEEQKRLRSDQYTGSNNPNASLTEQNVIEIKALLQQNINTRTLSARYNVGLGAIEGIKYGNTWKHV